MNRVLCCKSIVAVLAFSLGLGTLSGCGGESTYGYGYRTGYTDWDGPADVVYPYGYQRDVIVRDRNFDRDDFRHFDRESDIHRDRQIDRDLNHDLDRDRDIERDIQRDQGLRNDMVDPADRARLQRHIENDVHRDRQLDRDIHRDRRMDRRLDRDAHHD